MELVFAAILAALFVLLTAAFHLPERRGFGRRHPIRKLRWDGRARA